MNKGHGGDEASPVNLTPLMLLPLEMLEHMNAQYLHNSKVDLPFSHEDIVDEIFRRIGDATHMEQTKAKVFKAVTQRKPRRNYARFKRLALASVLCILIFTVTVGANIPNLFSFVSESTDTLTAEWAGGGLILETEDCYTSMREALEDHGLYGLAPNWIPGRFSLYSVAVEAIGETILIFALYDSETGDSFSMMVTQFAGDLLQTQRSTFELSGNYRTIQKGGVTHYLDFNYDQITVKWEYRDALCSISGNLSEQEARKIIASIYE